MIGATLNERYRLVAEIGRGGMGVVYRAHDTLLERDVAVKVMSATALGTEGRARLLREAQMVAQLNHPHIVTVYDVGEADDVPFIVMEFVAGTSLYERRPEDLEEIVAIARQVCAALEHAHEHGIVHRDLKPENVLLVYDSLTGTGGTVKLMDFGLARPVASRLTREGAITGTPFYLAPEQALGGEVDGRADLYALGVMLYELTTGQLPFTGDDVLTVIAQHLHAPVVPPRTHNAAVPAALDALIVRLLSKQPEDRPASVAEVRLALDDLLQPEGAFTTPLSSPVAGRRHNLPLQPTPFVGRAAVLAEIKARLENPACRLLTLVGPGGSGKTRLALQAAAGQLDKYPHGAFFVSLAPLDSVEAIAPTAAEALGFSFYAPAGGGAAVEPQQQLLDYLRQKRILLILDNYEHLLKGTSLVTEILRTAPEVKVLATSRVRLGVGGEHRFQVGGMEYPDEETTRARSETFAQKQEDATQYSAIKLFLQGARRAQPDFELTDENLSGVVQICRLVDGMPLRLRLAAAWVEMLAPAEIAAEMGQSLDFLETDRRDVPVRQRSMRAAFDYSWHLLTEREQAVMQALSVFRGGFTREAAQEVADASLRELMALVSKSLLHRIPAPPTALRIEGRFELHELLRQYTAEKLDVSPTASESARDRHCAYYAAALQRWLVDLYSARQQTALAEMDADIENARAAWNWAVQRRQVERMDQAVVGLRHFYAWRGRHQEGEAEYRLAAEKLGATTSRAEQLLLAQVLSIQGAFNWRLGRTESAGQQLGRSLSLLRRSEPDDQGVRLAKAYTLLSSGHLASDSDREEAKGLYEQSLALFRELGDQYGAAQALYALGEVTRYLGAYEEAKQFHTESPAMRQALGTRRRIADSLGGLSAIAVYQGQLEEGERSIRQSIAIRREIGDRVGIADGLNDWGVTLNYLGQYAKAHTPLE